MGACARTVGTFATVVVAFGLAALACSADEAGADDSGGSSGGPSAVAAAKATDGVKSGDETDVDCGGSSPKKCAIGQGCKVGADCETASCKAGTCAAPGPDDGAKNGDETDVDCGGAKAPKCAVGKGCAAHTDCESDACGADKKCIEFRSCTGTNGANTCGASGSESCCTMVPIQSGGTSFKIDKYQVTAGRMRAFIDRTKGDAKGWIAANKPTGWDDAWDPELLPATMEDALGSVGTYEKRGCSVKDRGGRTYWQPPVDGDAEEQSDLPQEELDKKALNCVTWHLAAALCAFDGKRLAKHSEITAVFKNGGANQYPWQFQDKTAYNPAAADERLNHRYNYVTPNAPANIRKQADGFMLDKAFYISPPGAFPKGANKDGVQDIAGDLMPWVVDGEKQFAWTFSWEDHKGDVSKGTWTGANGGGPYGYYAIGARCASD
jgi:formylglycine-generating enzyme required for sulfatase activity